VTIHARKRRLVSALTVVAASLAGALPSSAPAAPSAALRVHVQPVPLFTDTEPVTGYLHTGNRLGASASLVVEVALSGEEYSGGPPPLSGLSLLLPKGMRWSTAGMPRESGPSLEQPSPFCAGRCAQVGVPVLPNTVASGRYQFGREFLPEALSIESLDDSVGGTLLRVHGHDPVSLEFASEGTVTRHGGRVELRWPWTRVETVPGGLDGSTGSVALRLGSAVKAKHRTKFSLHMPKKCPGGGLSFEVTADFAAVGGVSAQVASATYRAPCPRP
jgi:hypothetical protein